MFGLFNKKKKSGRDEPPQNQTGQDQSASDDDAEFYQAVVNKFVTMLDAYVDANPDMPEFRDRWMFKLEDISAWTQSETTKRMSCKIVAVDMDEKMPSFSEWVHGFGETMDGAFDLGYSNWFETDLPVLIDVLQDKAVLSQEVGFENKATGQKVRGILGPVQFWSLGGDGPEPCCNSCIFTQALQYGEAELMSMKPPLMIKAVVGRNPDNTTTSDFRINDIQHDGIAAHLSDWARSWDGDGFAMRKQSLLFVNS